MQPARSRWSRSFAKKQGVHDACKRLRWSRHSNSREHSGYACIKRQAGARYMCGPGYAMVAIVAQACPKTSGTVVQPKYLVGASIPPPLPEPPRSAQIFIAISTATGIQKA